MILEKFKFLLLFIAFISFSGIADERTALDKKIDQIKELQALIDYDKKGIKNLIRELNFLDEKSPKKLSLQKLLDGKHGELNQKIEQLNTLIKAVSHEAESVSESEVVVKEQTLDEIEEEIGVDRMISSVKEKIDYIYRDFIKTPENKKWQKKKNDYFRIEEQKKKIILVE